MGNPNCDKRKALNALENHVIINLKGVDYSIKDKSNDPNKLIDETADWIYSLIGIGSCNASTLNLSEEEFKEINPPISKDRFRNFCRNRIRDYIEKDLLTMKIKIKNEEPIIINGKTWDDLLRYLNENFHPNENLVECTINYITKDEAIQKEMIDKNEPLSEK